VRYVCSYITALLLFFNTIAEPLLPCELVQCVHGTCINGGCICDGGWVGALCDQEAVSVTPKFNYTWPQICMQAGALGDSFISFLKIEEISSNNEIINSVNLQALDFAVENSIFTCFLSSSVFNNQRERRWTCLAIWCYCSRLSLYLLYL
jgi:hypothetical protein